MINVGGDNRASGSDFITDKFRSDIFRQTRAKAHSRMLVAQNFATNALAPHILANGDEFHLRCDDAPAGVVQLCDAAACFGAFWRQDAAKTQLVEAIICQPRFSVIGAAHGKFFGIAARIDPRWRSFASPC